MDPAYMDHGAWSVSTTAEPMRNELRATTRFAWEL